jgi:hypothetical protein
MTSDVLFANRPTHGLVTRAQLALGMSHREFGKALGASERTALRWAAGQSSVSVFRLRDLARLVHATDAALAAEIAATTSDTLESLGIVTAAPPVAAPAPRPDPLVLTEVVVCAAADELAVTPSAVRGVLLTAFRRARELGLRVEEVEGALAARAAKRAVKAKE